MKKVLVIYFTQSGQLNSAVRATLEPLERNSEIQIVYEQIRPKKPYPFPWSYMQFFDAFPESVQGIPCELEPFGFNKDAHFDLVVIAYQPWFLSISIPISSFMMTAEAQVLLKNKPVITILACRNMWLNAQEKMKLALKNAEAKLVGNITFVDKAGNLTSLVTVSAFALGGVRDKFLGIFPKYGVSDKDLKESAPKFGELVNKHLETMDFSSLQTELIDAGAINIKPNLVIMEGRGKVIFPLYANYVSKHGKASAGERRRRLRIFSIFLPTAILILSPLIAIVSRITVFLSSKKMKEEIRYYSGNDLR